MKGSVQKKTALKCTLSQIFQSGVVGCGSINHPVHRKTLYCELFAFNISIASIYTHVDQGC